MSIRPDTTYPPPPAPPGHTPGPSAHLLRAVSELASGSSPRGLAALSLTQTPSDALRQRADEARAHALRGVFAVADEDRDGYLSRAELGRALASLGLAATPSTLLAFELADGGGGGARPSAATLLSTSGRVDVATWVRVVLTRLKPGGAGGGPRSNLPEILSLLKEFDTAGDGAIKVTDLLHLLAGVDSPTALSTEEVRELLTLVGLFDPATLRDPRKMMAARVDYGALVRALAWV